VKGTIAEFTVAREANSLLNLWSRLRPWRFSDKPPRLLKEGTRVVVLRQKQLKVAVVTFVKCALAKSQVERHLWKDNRERAFTKAVACDHHSPDKEAKEWCSIFVLSR
jgi:hypothetical protein